MRGRVKLLGGTALMAAMGFLPLVVGWGDLPDPVATHWGVGGQPDGTTPAG